MSKYFIGTSAFVNPDLLLNCVKTFPKGIESAIYFDGWKRDAIFEDVIINKKIKDYVNYLTPKISNHVGCSGAWNHLLDMGFNKYNSDYVIIVGSDMVFHDGFWDAFFEDLEKIKPEMAVASHCAFNCWVLSKKGFEDIGTWDENFFPAYVEDNDYDYRRKLAGHLLHTLGKPLFEHKQSSTISTNSFISRANSITFNINKSYFRYKWGGVPLEEKWLHPYNNVNMKFTEWEFQKETYEKSRELWRHVV